MDWSQEKSMQLINEYRKRSILWDLRDASSYYNKMKKDQAWRELAGVCERTTIEVKKKIDSLKASYRREKLRAKKFRKSARGRVFQSKWYAYTSLSFLDNVGFKPNQTRNAMPIKSYEIPGDYVDDSEEVSQPHDDLMDDEATNPLPSDAGERSSDIDKSEFNTSRKLLPVYDFPKITEAFSFRQQTSANSKTADKECSIFGEYIAEKLRTFDDRSRAVAQHRIGNILFELEMYQNPHVDSILIQSCNPNLATTVLPSLQNK